MGRKLGGDCAPLGEGELSPHLTQCGQDRGLPARQVSSWSVQPFGHSARTSQTDWTGQDRTHRQRSDSIGRTVLQTVEQKFNFRRPYITRDFSSLKLFPLVTCTLALYNVGATHGWYFPVTYLVCFYHIASHTSTMYPVRLICCKFSVFHYKAYVMFTWRLRNSWSAIELKTA